MGVERRRTAAAKHDRPLPHGDSLPGPQGARRRAAARYEAGIPVDGASDHGVSEAIYLRDPDQNGVELYRDRPKEEWPRTEDGSFTMIRAPLDLQALLDELTD